MWPPQLREVSVGFYEHFLGYVFRFLVVTYPVIGLRMHHFLILVYKAGKRSLITLEAMIDECCIIWFQNHPSLQEDVFDILDAEYCRDVKEKSQSIGFASIKAVTHDKRYTKLYMM